MRKHLPFIPTTHRGWRKGILSYCWETKKHPGVSTGYVGFEGMFHAFVIRRVKGKSTEIVKVVGFRKRMSAKSRAKRWLDAGVEAAAKVRVARMVKARRSGFYSGTYEDYMKSLEDRHEP